MVKPKSKRRIKRHRNRARDRVGKEKLIKRGKILKKQDQKKENLNIAFFTETYTPQVNGAVTSINSFVSELLDMGHSVDIFAPAPGPDAWEGARVYRFKSITFFPYPEFRASLPSGKVYKLVKKNKYDIIHTHGPFALGYQGWKAAVKYGIPHLTTFHTPIADYVGYLLGGKNSPLVPAGKAIAWWYTRWYYNRFPLVISPSFAIAQLLRDNGITPSIKIIRTGISLSEFDSVKHSKDVRDKFGIDNDFIIHSGRLSHEKNVSTILRAFSIIKDKLDIDLVITSRGPLLARLQSLAMDLGLEGRVHFTGYVDRVDQIKLFKEAEFGMIASDAETQGLVILEEMACRIPVIGSNYLAIPEAIKDGWNGLLFKLYDHNDLANKIYWMIEHDNDRRRMKKNARKTAEENTNKIWTNKLLNVYEGILSNRRY